MDSLPQPTQSDAIAELVARSKRQRGVPLRRTFLQQQGKAGTKSGPLSLIVRHHDERALDLYLLVQLVAVGKPYKVRIEAGGWARPLGLSKTSGPSAVSRTWKRLAALQLITRGREARMAAITLLREDGSGAAYTRPSGDPHDGEYYFNIPLEYWTHGWYGRLSLCAKAMLLIALSLPDDFYLPVEKAHEWYGVSTDTAQRGLAELREAELIECERGFKAAPLTAQGWTADYRYTLQPPFGPKNARHPETGAEQ